MTRSSGMMSCARTVAANTPQRNTTTTDAVFVRLSMGHENTAAGVTLGAVFVHSSRWRYPGTRRRSPHQPAMSKPVEAYGARHTIGGTRRPIVTRAGLTRKLALVGP